MKKSFQQWIGRLSRTQTRNLLLAVALSIAPGGMAQSPAYTYQEVTIPGATLLDVQGINASGDLVGAYFDGAAHGFVRRQGVIENIQIPGARFTVPYGINNSGEIVGYIIYPNGFNTRPFLRNRDGSIVLLEGQGIAEGINSSGTIVGGQFSVGQIFYHGQRTFFSYPLPGDTVTNLRGINGKGDFVGQLVLFDETFPAPGEDPFNQQLAFIVDKNGPRILPTPSRLAAATGINGSGDVAGYYILAPLNPAGTDEVWLAHGFVYSGGQLNTVDAPGSSDWPLTLTVDDPDFGMVELQRIYSGTILNAINDQGQTVARSFASYLDFDTFVSQDFERTYIGTPVD